MLHKDLTGKIINCAYQVQKTLGFGFLESVYQNALLHELTKAGLQAQKEQNIEVTYDNQIVGNFTADIVVEDRDYPGIKIHQRPSSASRSPVK